LPPAESLLWPIIQALASLGAQGAITGKALYEKKFSLSAALQEAQNAC
jgi:phosphoribosylformimino-5-aminoimidazole carboxamide ribonucleotide (ProFAR) isomerase